MSYPKVITFIICLVFPCVLSAEVHYKKICMRNTCIQAEIVSSASDRQIGLMFRGHLAEDKGMLFVFESEDYHAFWMKNMHFAIDFIWMDSDKKVIYISRDVQPCRNSCDNFMPSEKTKYVLEVCSGFADKNNLHIGDKAVF